METYTFAKTLSIKTIQIFMLYTNSQKDNIMHKIIMPM